MRRRVSRRSLLALTGVASMSGFAISRGLIAPACAAAGPVGGMRRILLINPNTSQTTTDMMVRIAQLVASDNVEIVGATAQHGPSMIVDPTALAASAPPGRRDRVGSRQGRIRNHHQRVWRSWHRRFAARG